MCRLCALSAWVLALVLGCGEQAEERPRNYPKGSLARTGDAPRGDLQGDDSRAGDPLRDGDNHCATEPIWLVSGDGQVEVADGRLFLVARFDQGPVRVFQEGISGDFDLRVDFWDFGSGGSYSRAQMQVYVTGAPPPDPPLLPGAGDSFASARRGEGAITSVIHHDNYANEQSRNAIRDHGTFRIQRIDGALTVQAITDGGSEFSGVGSPFPFEPLTVALELQTPVTGSTSCGECEAAVVAFDDFRVVGNEVQPDDFACDRLLR